MKKSFIIKNQIKQINVWKFCEGKKSGTGKKPKTSAVKYIFYFTSTTVNFNLDYVQVERTAAAAV